MLLKENILQEKDILSLVSKMHLNTALSFNLPYVLTVKMIS